jgi:4a-hydroxytetrahydrobiopterin dehydratase
VSNKESTLSDAEVADRLARLPGWRYDRGWLRREYRTEGWQSTLLLVNAIGFLAEAAYHHPDLAVSWARLEVKLMTHSAGGITEKDIALAERIDAVVLWSPEPSSTLTGPPKPLVRGQQT